ncbi:MAG: DUF2177 family protein [archaeon]
MKKKFLSYILIIVFTLVIDLVYLSFLMKGFYDAQLIPFERTIRIIPALLVWILIPLGVIIFVLPRSKELKKTVFFGAVYGFIVYGVYDLTNYAILEQWPIVMTIADIIWGTALCSIVSFVGYYLLRNKS